MIDHFCRFYLTQVQDAVYSAGGAAQAEADAEVAGFLGDIRDVLVPFATASWLTHSPRVMVGMEERLRWSMAPPAVAVSSPRITGPSTSPGGVSRPSPGLQLPPLSTGAAVTSQSARASPQASQALPQAAQASPVLAHSPIASVRAVFLEGNAVVQFDRLLSLAEQYFRSGCITAAEFEEHQLTVWQAVTDVAVAAMPPSLTMGTAAVGDLAKDPAVVGGQKRTWTDVTPPKDPSVLPGPTFDDYQRVRCASVFLVW